MELKELNKLFNAINNPEQKEEFIKNELQKFHMKEYLHKHHDNLSETLTNFIKKNPEMVTAKTSHDLAKKHGLNFYTPMENVFLRAMRDSAGSTDPEDQIIPNEERVNINRMYALARMEGLPTSHFEHLVDYGDKYGKRDTEKTPEDEISNDIYSHVSGNYPLTLDQKLDPKYQQKAYEFNHKLSLDRDIYHAIGMGDKENINKIGIDNIRNHPDTLAQLLQNDYMPEDLGREIFKEDFANQFADVIKNQHALKEDKISMLSNLSKFSPNNKVIKKHLYDLNLDQEVKDAIDNDDHEKLKKIYNEVDDKNLVHNAFKQEIDRQKFIKPYSKSINEALNHGFASHLEDAMKQFTDYEKLQNYTHLVQNHPEGGHPFILNQEQQLKDTPQVPNKDLDKNKIDQLYNTYGKDVVHREIAKNYDGNDNRINWKHLIQNGFYDHARSILSEKPVEQQFDFHTLHGDVFSKKEDSPMVRDFIEVLKKHSMPDSEKIELLNEFDKNHPVIKNVLDENKTGQDVFNATKYLNDFSNHDPSHLNLKSIEVQNKIAQELVNTPHLTNLMKSKFKGIAQQLKDNGFYDTFKNTLGQSRNIDKYQRKNIVNLVALLKENNFDVEDLEQKIKSPEDLLKDGETHLLANDEIKNFLSTQPQHTKKLLDEVKNRYGEESVDLELPETQLRHLQNSPNSENLNENNLIDHLDNHLFGNNAVHLNEYHELPLDAIKLLNEVKKNGGRINVNNAKQIFKDDYPVSGKFVLQEDLEKHLNEKYPKRKYMHSLWLNDYQQVLNPSEKRGNVWTPIMNDEEFNSLTPKVKEVQSQMYQTHPRSADSLGWVRYHLDHKKKKIFIEEVQHDFYPLSKENKNLDPEKVQEYNDGLEGIHKIHNRNNLPRTLLNHFVSFLHQKGIGHYEVKMATPEILKEKEAFKGDPAPKVKQIYEEFPKKMGFKETTVTSDDDLDSNFHGKRAWGLNVNENK